LESEAKLQAVKAFETYSPSIGVKLSTHLTNYLKKVNRLAYKHQEIYTVPEDRRIKYHTFDRVKENLKDSLDRDPTIEEMAHELKWSRAEVGRYYKEQRRELSDTQPHANDIPIYTDTKSALLSYAYHDLPPKDKLLLEYTMGYGGKPKMSDPEIMRKLNMTRGQLSYAKKLLTNKVGNAIYG
jgi:DNA-directed RNA polymerase specialized sigma subunit